MTFEIRNYYLQTPLDRQEYVCIKLADIPLDFFDKYKLKDFVDANGRVYFNIKNGVYGLPQSGVLAQALLRETPQTPRLLPVSHHARPLAPHLAPNNVLLTS